MTLPATSAAHTSLVLDPGSLAERAGQMAGKQPAKLTRDTSAGIYRAVVMFVGLHAALLAETVRAYREQLEHAERSPAN